MQTATQFAWSCLSMGDYPPPEPKKGPRFGPDRVCWLCGGETGGVGWPLDKAIPSTFAEHSSAAAPESRTACQACAAFAAGETWQNYVTERSPVGVKLWGTASWRCYGHFFTPHSHACPRPSEWRALFLEPPEPPFLAVISLSGQKNLIFRAGIAYSQDYFPVQVEEARIYLRRDEFSKCLGQFEMAMNLGFSKESILTGIYNQSTIIKVGVSKWREVEKMILPWRENSKRLLDLVHYCAVRSEHADDEKILVQPEQKFGQLHLI